ncbi:hypothetical protein LOTGIDRAFT_105773 [Lottia gigantea]|uniref:G-protein coupled receptors family 1 profile domain-containing protein n=1 Tax=Lottia gigantea TaxID=225164 RepID=V4BRG9_LOTGI|nr:hypothetical protein LOTGIDRAFT_105773 [Lottia gigantea]ESO91469.1 hypothetical protein LOTGIDRAFT_105773 [Lottia gigantea]
MDNITDIPNATNLELWANWYRHVHGYAAPIVCIFGVVANILNIVVLTRKNMISPTNVILTGLAVSDGLTMAVYFIYAILSHHIYVNRPTPLTHAQFVMFYAIFSVIAHSISIWLTVALALFRYIFIRCPRRGGKLCSIDRAKLTVVIVSFVTTVVCIPNAVSYQIVDQGNGSSWYVDVKKTTATEIILTRFNFWIQAMLVKLIPCFLLTILSILLVKTMKDAEKRRKKLLSKPMKGSDDPRRPSKTNRTTRMLLAVVILFLVTEIPQGILNLISGIEEDFFDNVYTPLGDLMDILALINNGINFILYCTMSKQFRDTFIKLFLKDLVMDNNRGTYHCTQVTRDTEL